MAIGIGIGIGFGASPLGGPGMSLSAAANDDPLAKYGLAHSRASAGTYIGADGLLASADSGVLRRTWNPVTGRVGWLYEQASTQLRPSTTTEYAATGGVTTTTLQSDPFGETGAMRVTCTAGVSSHFAACGGVSYVAGTTYTLSKFVFPGTAARVQLAGESAAFTTLDEYANFWLTGDGSVTSQGAGAIAAGVEYIGNGWYRVWITAVADVTISAVAGPVSFLLATGLESRGPSVEGGGLTFTVFGSQVEAGPLSSYIIPTGATTARAADSLMLTGTVGRTNYVKNSSGVGGTSSTLPTGWTSLLTQAGITAAVVGKTTDPVHGDCWDVRFQGTASASGDLRVYFGGPTDIPSANGVQWTLSAALARIAGAVPAGRTFNLVIGQRDAATAFLTATSDNISATAGASLSRLSHTTTTSHASVAYLWTYFNCAIVSGDVVDFTLRVAAPQIEKAAAFTSYIPTSGYARTVENVASWFNNDEGTFVWRGRTGPAISATAIILAAVGDATMANAQWLYLPGTTRKITGEGRSGGAATLSGIVSGSTIAVGQDVVASWAWGADYGLAVASGVAATADTSGALPVGMSRFSIGSGAASGLSTVGSQIIYSIECYPRRLSAVEQQALTV